jgi:hypothetical protein
MRRQRGANIVSVNVDESSAGTDPDGKSLMKTSCLARSTLRSLVSADDVDGEERCPECETGS